MVFFETQPLGVNKSPHRPHVCLDPACCQFPRQLAQGEWPRANALAQPVGIGPSQNWLFVTSDLAGRKAPGLPPQILPLRHTGRTDLKRLGNRTNRLAGVSPRHSAFANVFRIGSRHPCWPPFPSMEFESEIIPAGNPDSGKKQHALGGELKRVDMNASRMGSSEIVYFDLTDLRLHIRTTIRNESPAVKLICVRFSALKDSS